MLNIGPQELIVILIIALLVVGPQRLPELSRQIGKGLREFRKIQDDVKDMVKLDLDAPDPTPSPARSPTSSCVSLAASRSSRSFAPMRSSSSLSAGSMAASSVSLHSG